ncbi:3-mercaptopyruvate sulfurtransferase [Polycladidibacter stylochi]|uniref:3-mercaptopyruvate sulfurtransferase n=1 Tax=Polycladidibacter stylochi TaxID=1807766 RepID=UPI00082AB902|nr:3-mercaptopyruvate sulfurtransferase [Pseudovibrio stylochi]
MLNDPIVSVSWLQQHLDAPDLVVVDGSWYLPDMARDPIADYQKEHIPGAIFFDIDAISDQQTDLPHMVPSAEQFASAMRQLGINDGQTIVVYDGMGLFSAARVWWMFKLFGVERVYLLDGGLPAWKAENLPLTDKLTERSSGQFTPKLNHELMRNLDQVKTALDDGKTLVLDARGPDRFAGNMPEPRPGVRPGHMKGAKNLPFSSLLRDGKMLASADLKALFSSYNLNDNTPVITSCGSGVTAAVISLALTRIGHPNHALYDGSWAEWGSSKQVEVINETA